MAFQLEQSGEKGVLHISGDLTIESAEELKSILITSMNQVDTLVLDLAGVKTVDLSGLQLICAANFTSESFQKKIMPECNGSDVFRKALTEAGLGHDQCMDGAKCNTCLWEGMNDDE